MRFLNEQFSERFPPLCRIGSWCLYVFDERWRLPYRWCEWKYAQGYFGLMLFGPAVIICRDGKLRDFCR